MTRLLPILLLLLVPLVANGQRPGAGCGVDMRPLQTESAGVRWVPDSYVLKRRGMTVEEMWRFRDECVKEYTAALLANPNVRGGPEAIARHAREYAHETLKELMLLKFEVVIPPKQPEAPK